MKYFSDCTTLDQAKTLFRKLAFKFHPDTGGKASDYIEMRKQFENLNLKSEYKTEEEFNFKKFEAQIFEFRNLEDVNIQFVGSFIWVSDAKKFSTYKQKDKLNAIRIEGYNKGIFASEKKMWYFSPEGYKKSSTKKLSIDEIKNLYGCKTYKQTGRLKLA